MKNQTTSDNTKASRNKKARLLLPSDQNITSLDDGVTNTAWQHYQNYLDSCEDEDDTGDIDELQELLEILNKYKAVWMQNHSRDGDDDDDDDRILQQICASRTNLLPVLVSVAHGILADQCMSDYFNISSSCTSSRSDNDNDNDNNDATKRQRQQQQQEDLIKTIQHHFTESLTACRWNASVWSMAANWSRMQLSLKDKNNDDDTDRSSNNHFATVAAAYQWAAHCAHKVRQTAIALLEQAGETEQDDSVKEWIELLLLNQVTGVQWTDDGENDNENEEYDDDDDQEKEQKLDKEQVDENQDGCWSASLVEGTARFMSAMLMSTLGDHDGALYHLKQFPHLTHRLHPNLWNTPAALTQETIEEESSLSSSSSSSPVVSFRHPYNGVLPKPLYQRLCQVFAPDASYWKESDYDNRGYYSYFMDLPDTSKPPTNLLEDVIFYHLLPLVRQKLPKKQADQICGAEWWVHTRPIQANLGHNMHFDTDEALLEQQKQITHPIFSSVLYLTGDKLGGATIVLDQTPDAKDVANEAWVSVPSDNSYLIFPGDRLHGVLPCRGTTKSNSTKIPAFKAIQVSDLFHSKNGSSPKKDPSQKHRLTFLVGFWTRRVPDNIKNQKLYSPCGPLPPQTDEHTWVRHVFDGYKDGMPLVASAADNLKEIAVPKVSPAWEQLVQTSNALDDDPPLEIPRGIDHRFFVQGAPRCFYDALFEKDEYKYNDKDQDSGEE